MLRAGRAMPAETAQPVHSRDHVTAAHRIARVWDDRGNDTFVVLARCSAIFFHLAFMLGFSTWSSNCSERRPSGRLSSSDKRSPSEALAEEFGMVPLVTIKLLSDGAVRCVSVTQRHGHGAAGASGEELNLRYRRIESELFNRQRSSTLVTLRHTVPRHTIEKRDAAVDEPRGGSKEGACTAICGGCGSKSKTRIVFRNR
eukprot:2769162-Rhodomonas_salina.1